MAGKTITALARETGVSRSHLSREANAPETRLVLEDLLAQHHKRVKRLVGRSLTAIDQAFRAYRIIPARDSDGDAITLDGGADHYARLTAAKRVLELLEAAAPKQPLPTGGGHIEWEAFLHLYQERTTDD